MLHDERTQRNENSLGLLVSYVVVACNSVISVGFKWLVDLYEVVLHVLHQNGWFDVGNQAFEEDHVGLHRFEVHLVFWDSC